MKPFKFRVWDNRDKIYPSGKFALDSQGKLLTFYEQRHDYYDIKERQFNEVKNPKNYVIEYSTGLLDKNGVEIYEGDFFINHSNPCVSNIFLCKEEYNSLLAKNLNNDWFTCPMSYFVEASPDVEIIGNINQNPDIWRINEKHRRSN